MTGGLRCGQIPSSQMCCSFSCSAAGWRGRRSGAIEERWVFCSGIGSFNVDFSPVYVRGFAPEFPVSTHTDTILLLSLANASVCDLQLRSHSIGIIITSQWLTDIFAPVSESTSGTSEGGHTGRDVPIGECVCQREPLARNCQEKRGLSRFLFCLFRTCCWFRGRCP